MIYFLIVLASYVATSEELRNMLVFPLFTLQSKVSCCESSVFTIHLLKSTCTFN